MAVRHRRLPDTGVTLIKEADASVDGRIEIRFAAGIRLYRHFSILAYDRNGI